MNQKGISDFSWLDKVVYIQTQFSGLLYIEERFYKVTELYSYLLVESHQEREIYMERDMHGSLEGFTAAGVGLSEVVLLQTGFFESVH